MTIESVEFAHLDPTVGWNRRLVLCTDRRLVEVREGVGNGVPEREYYGLDPVLGGLPLDLADSAHLVAYLASDEAQTLLRLLCDDRGPDEDGNDRWQDALDGLNAGVTEAVEASPRYWDAGDFFQYASDDEVFGDAAAYAEVVDGNADTVLEARAHALCAEAAQDGHRLVVSEVRRHLDRRWADALPEVRERLCDDVAGSDEDDELFDGADLSSLAACVSSLFSLWPCLDRQPTAVVTALVAARYRAYAARRAEVAP